MMGFRGFVATEIGIWWVLLLTRLYVRWLFRSVLLIRVKNKLTRYLIDIYSRNLSNHT
jgi:hypothetical protein